MKKCHCCPAAIPTDTGHLCPCCRIMLVWNLFANQQLRHQPAKYEPRTDQNRLDLMAAAMRQHSIDNQLALSPDSAAWDAIPESRRDLWRKRATFVLTYLWDTDRFILNHHHDHS